MDLGPVCQALNINCGDKMDYLTSVSTADFTMGPKENELAARIRSMLPGKMQSSGVI